MTKAAEHVEDWPYDADGDDPLAAMRIPVTSEFPSWRYIACFHRDSEARPTDTEAAMLISFAEEYKHHFFGDGPYRQKVDARALDVEERVVTRVFHKWGEGDWSYRIVTWEYGPFWVPVPPRQRGGEHDHPKIPGPLTLVQVMDRIHTFGDDKPMQHWLDWKRDHPEVFGS